MSARKYFWTAEQDEMLRQCYAKARGGTKGAASAIDIAVGATGYPRNIISLRAGYLGITRDARRPWTTREMATLREMAGSHSTKEIARRLGRAHSSVTAQMDHQHLSRAMKTEGLTREQVTKVFSVSAFSVRGWVQRQRLSESKDGRFRRAALVRFFVNHYRELDLRVMDQAWLKDCIGAALEGKSLEEPALEAAGPDSGPWPDPDIEQRVTYRPELERIAEAPAPVAVPGTKPKRRALSDEPGWRIERMLRLARRVA